MQNGTYKICLSGKGNKAYINLMCQRCLETKLSCKKPAHFFNREKHKKEKSAAVVVVASKGSGIFYSLFFHFHVLKTSFAKFFSNTSRAGVSNRHLAGRTPTPDDV
jgi:hypothetical protein